MNIAEEEDEDNDESEYRHARYEHSGLAGR